MGHAMGDMLAAALEECACVYWWCFVVPQHAADYLLLVENFLTRSLNCLTIIKRATKQYSFLYTSLTASL